MSGPSLYWGYYLTDGLNFGEVYWDCIGTLLKGLGPKQDIAVKGLRVLIDRLTRVLM